MYIDSPQNEKEWGGSRHTAHVVSESQEKAEPPLNVCAAKWICLLA